MVALARIRSHEGLGFSRKSKLIRIKGLAGRCCYGAACRPTSEEENPGEEEPARGTEGICEQRREAARCGRGKDRGYNGDHSLDADWSSQVCGKMAGWLAGCCHRRCYCFCFSVLVSSPFLALATTVLYFPSSSRPCRNSSSTLRCRSSLLRGLRCFTYVPNRCMYVYTPVRNNAGRATTLAHLLLRPTTPASRSSFHPSRAIPTLTYTYSIRRPPTSPVSPSPSPPWHRFYHPQRTPSLVSFHALVLLSSLERASLSPVSTSVFLKCPIQSARRVRYRK